MYNERKLQKEGLGEWLVKNVLDTITSYREARNWSIYDLASEAGIKPTTISSWYRKNIMPTLPTLEKLCDAFNVSVSEFFSVVESAEREPIVLTHEQATMLEKWLNLLSVNLSYLHMSRPPCLKNGLIYGLNSVI
jgi:transcriptional regulator with XRE-family HTH domain